MKHIFLLNPAAGRKRAEQQILPAVLAAVKDADVDYEIHRTMNPGDACRFAKTSCDAEKNRLLRFYAIGGDGTLNEVVNGIIGVQNAELALIPAGTGNDFTRMFSNPAFFLDIRRQLSGHTRVLDLIRCNDRFFINMLNIGLDCAVVAKTDEMKKNPFLQGSLAYLVSVASVLGRNKGYPMRIEFSDGTVMEDTYTLAAVGNGAFCGGGFKGVPKACLNDGLLDVSLIRKVSRRSFLALVASYHKGTHLAKTGIDGIVTYRQCREVKISSTERMQICMDGEIAKTREVELELFPSAIRFSVPEGCE